MAISISISITQNSQNISANTSNVTVAVKATWTYGSYNKLEKSGWLNIDGTVYDFTSPFNTAQLNSGSQTLFSKKVNVSHNGDGAKVLKCSASYTSGVSSGTVAASASKTLTTIPRKSTMSVSNGTLGTAIKMTVSRKSSNFSHAIMYECGKTSGTVVGQTDNTSISWTPPLSLASQNTTGTTVSITLKLTTFNGSTSLGMNSYTITCSMPNSVAPTCALAVSDPTGNFDKYGVYVQGLSKFDVTVTPTISYNSAIASYKVNANNSIYTKASFTTGALKSYGTLEVYALVTDTRGRTGSASKRFTVLNYNAPIVNSLTVKRCNADGVENNKGEYVIVAYSGEITPLDDKNGARYTLMYRKTSETAYTSVTLPLPEQKYYADDTYIFPADTGSSYDVLLSISDDFNTSSRATSVSSAFTLMHWLKSGLGMAIGKIAELDNVFDIGMQTRFFGGILHPVLEPETDLNEIRTPNTYVGANVSTYNYENCPISGGTFSLTVTGMGESGQVKQRLEECRKTDARVYERVYYTGGWGEWVCVSDFSGTLLWSNSYYMTSGQTATLSESVSMQRSGIVLVFSEYVDGEAANQSFHCRFIPKMLVAEHNGKAQCIQLSTSNLEYFATKYLYVSNDKITGHDNNKLTGTAASGITYTNNRFVLRYVIGV